MVFAWIAVAVLCSIHLIFSLVQSWVESKKTSVPRTALSWS